MKWDQETYSMISLVSTALFLGYYIVMVLRLPDGMEGQAGAIFPIFLTTTILFILTEIVIVSLLLWRTKAKDMEKDERDNLIGLKADRNAGMFLFAVVYLVQLGVLVALMVGSLARESAFLSVIFHVLFATLFCSYLLKRISEVYMYRQGA